MTDKIAQLLSSGNDIDIELGLYLLVKFHNDEMEFHAAVLKVYRHLQDVAPEKAWMLTRHCLWIDFYRDNYERKSTESNEIKD